MDDDAIGTILLDSAFRIHRKLGPGLLESAYETILAYELKRNGLKVQRQVVIPIVYETIVLPNGYRADIMVEDRVVVEVKSSESLQPVHSKQLLTYLRLANKRLGYVLNFGEYSLKDGISRVING
ncbi:MAG: GxxExxY protein [Verrucomicrobia bacterium]|nr:GxxExxY protein [Verrucomicrobiota bacterium]